MASVGCLKCPFLLTRGPNKGKRCDKINCKAHIHKNPPTTSSICDLPDHVRDLIIDKFIGLKPKIPVYMALACANKELYSLLNEKTKLKTLVDAHIDPSKVEDKSLSYKDQLCLYGSNGCQFCCAPRIRKVYPMFKVRCCEKCLHEKTINEYYLRTKYKIPGSILDRCRSRRVQLYNRSGYYDADYIWIEDVVAIVGNLDDYREAQVKIIREQEEQEILAYLESIKSKSKTYVTAVTLDDIKRLTPFVKNSGSIELSNSMMQMYVKTAKTAMVEEEKMAFIQNQPDHQSFSSHDAMAFVKYAKTYTNMGRRDRSKWSSDDWNAIKDEALRLWTHHVLTRKFEKFTVYSYPIFIPRIFGMKEVVELLDGISEDPEKDIEDIVSKVPVINVCKTARSNECCFCESKKKFAWDGLVTHQSACHPDQVIRYVFTNRTNLSSSPQPSSSSN